MKMADAQEDNEDDFKDVGDVRRARAPSKKKFEEEMEALSNSIRKTEEQLEALKNNKPSSFADAMKNLKAEKNANIERRKKIDADLQKLNKDITEMMHNISRLESTLHYRSEDKIDGAIKRLEWSLKVQNFKLSQEKKIVAEIDSLRRSKKTLMQYLSKKKEKDAMRDRQRRMREERDYYFHKVTELKQKEEKLRSDNSVQRAKAEQLKKELDQLYETKRQMVSIYKKQRDDFFDDREKRRHESFKKRIEEKQALQAALCKEKEEYEAQKQPYEDNICLCNTLIQYLQRFISNTDLESSSPGVSVTPPAVPSPSDEALPSGPAEEIEDGQYVLLRKSEDDSYVSGLAKHSARKQRRSRKQSMVKRITHTPAVLAQFLQLNLNAPATVSEILASLEQLRARKLYYEREAEVKSELSVTESAQCEVSRQASHTESSDGLCDSHPNDRIMEQLLQLSVSDHACSPADDCHTSDRIEDYTTKTNAPCPEYSSVSCSPHCAETDSTHSGSRSEGSDSTPCSSSTVEGAGGELEEAVAQSVCDDTVLEPVQNEDSGTMTPSSTTQSDAACDCNSDVFCATKAQADLRHTSGENCSDSSSKGVMDHSKTLCTAVQQSQSDHGGELHICMGKMGDPTSLDSPSTGHPSCDTTNITLPESTNVTLPKGTNMSSLEEFPVLMRGSPRDFGVCDRSDLHGCEAFLIKGKKTSIAESTQL